MAMFNVEAILRKPEVQEIGEQLRAVLTQVAGATTFAEREELAIAVTNGLLREYLCDDLTRMAETYGERVEIEGRAYKQHEAGVVGYHSLVGTLRIARYTYREEGVRNGPTRCPLEMEAGLVSGATPALAKSIAHGYAERDMRAHLVTLKNAGRVPPSRTTLERIATAIGRDTASAQAGIEHKIRRMEQIAAGSVAVVIGIDRTSVAMREERPEGAEAKTPTRTKPYQRRPPEPYDVAFRMAYVGTVALVDAFGKAQQIRRYAVPAEDDAAEVVERMMGDVREVKRQDPTLTVGVVQDGAPEMWNLARAGLDRLREEHVLVYWREGIDRFHVMEHLGEALSVTSRTDAQRSALLDEWTRSFDESNATIDLIEAALRLDRVSLRGAQRDAMDEQLTYIANNKDRMRYVSLREAGLPVGSGVTESSAKTVIGLRAKRGGQQWGNQLRGALALRAIVQSERFDPFWAHFARRYAANVNNLEAA
jgi:hypothetical protein